MKLRRFNQYVRAWRVAALTLLLFMTPLASHALDWESFGKSGVYAKGSYWEQGGRSYISGYVKDTKANARNASLEINFFGPLAWMQSRSEKVVNNLGAGKAKYFRFNSQYTYRVNIRECIDSGSTFESCGPWQTIKTTMGSR